MFVAVMSFHAQVSDPSMGGTYMTLLNTLSNLGGTWTGTCALWLVDVVSFKDCEGVADLSLDCDTMQELKVSRTHQINWGKPHVRHEKEMQKLIAHYVNCSCPCSIIFSFFRLVLLLVVIV